MKRSLKDLEKKPKNAVEKITKAARHCFVEKGFDGASMSQIAKVAEVSRPLLFHHFKTKDALWLAAKMDIVNEVKRQKSPLPGLDQSFESFLKEAVFNLFHFYQNQPDLMRLLAWQRVGSYEKSETSDDAKQWLEAFTHYQNTAEAKVDVPAAFMVTLLFSSVFSAVMDDYPVLDCGSLESPYPEFIFESLLLAFKR